MSFEESDDGDDRSLWDWGRKTFAKTGREARFEPLQLQLPLGADALKEGPAPEPRPTGWQLPAYLKFIGVAEPLLVAERLTSEFHSLPLLLEAPARRIRTLAGNRIAEAVRIAGELMKAALLERAAAAPVTPWTDALADFLNSEIGFLEEERLLSLYLNSELRLIGIETIADGDSGQVLLHARKIIACGLAIQASGFVLVHNHPSGRCRPSNADIAATAHIRRLSAELGLELIDHLIVARGRIASIQDHWREARWSQAGRAEAAVDLAAPPSQEASFKGNRQF